MAASTFFAHMPLDWLLIGVLAVVIAFDATRNGASRAAALALSLPLCALLFAMVSHTAVLATISAQFVQPVEQAVLFGIIFIALFFLMYRIAYGSYGGVGLLPGIIAGVASVVVLAVTWLDVPALQALWHPAPLAQAVFAAQYRFWWLVGAYVVLAGARS